MEHPKVIILLKTWQGPRERNLAQNRLKSARRMLAGIKKYLVYPNYSWHIADNGSDKWYQDEIHALFKDEKYTFTSTKANGDIGLSINMAMRVVLKETDFVLHWSDDIVLERTLNIVSYVAFLRDHDDIGIVYLRNGHPSFGTACMDRAGAMWHNLTASSSGTIMCVTSFTLMHRRSWDYFGPYPEGLRIDMLQREMAWRYRHFPGGPKVVIPDDLWRKTLPLCVGLTTWEWRLQDEKEQKSWHRYRSYNARFEKEHNGDHI